MVCIYCNSSTAVTNSRNQLKLNSKWRRRQCTKCNSILTTVESVDYSKAIIVASKNSVIPFSRDKLFISIYSSCKHRVDAISSADALTETVIAKIVKSLIDATISTDQIKKLVKAVLKRFDKSAYVQYDAYHK